MASEVAESEQQGSHSEGKKTVSQRECVLLHTGQAGVQIGNAMWELFCLEHDIAPDGRFLSKKNFQGPVPQDRSIPFFERNADDTFVPRVVMADLEPTVIDQIRKGKFRDLYHPDQLFSWKEDAANNFARGHFTVGKEVLGVVAERVRRVVEKCDSLQGFFSFRSGGGGTGSGFGTLLMEELVQEHPKKCQLELVLNPGLTMSTAMVEPYNSVLSTHSALSTRSSNCTFLMDNEALYDISRNKLSIERPSYATLNRLLAQVVSSVTTSLRFNGPLNVDLQDFNTNLVPYPRLHFPVTTYSPFIPKTKVFHNNFSIREITSECFEPFNQLVKCNLKKGKFVSCCLLYRGDVVPKDINVALNLIKGKRSIQFVDWCPTGFKIGINHQSPRVTPQDEMSRVHRACCMLGNSTSVTETWEKIGTNFDVMFRKKAFIHWYLAEGMEEDDFMEARTDLEALRLDYMEVLKDLPGVEDNPEAEF